VVDRAAVTDGEDLTGLHMTKHRYLGLDTLVKPSLFAAAGNQVGSKTKPTEVTDRGLSRLGLLLANRSNCGDQRDVDQGKVIVTDAKLELPHGLNKGCRLNVSDSASELDNADVRFLASVIDGDSGDALDPVLDGIGDVGDDLDGLAEIVALALALDDIAVDLAGGDVVGTGKGHVQVTLVVAKVKVNLSTIVQHKDLAWVGEGENVKGGTKITKQTKANKC
jgi:hypothetical protein